MTEKLYYQDPYQKQFCAVVTGCEPCKEGYLITLDRTAFYPEGGGQPGDSGCLDGVEIFDTHEKNGEIFHSARQPLEVGTQVKGEIDWEKRFTRMQQHTGEHIVSGIIHRLYGWNNVGFHMGHDVVTIDFNGELDEQALEQVEQLANQAVWDNLAVQTTLPAPQDLAVLDYRSKKELSGQVRIVTIPGVDVCACCGTQLSHTGEIGVIKLISSQRYKGGTRITMLCGGMALADYAVKNRENLTLSGMLSAKPCEVVQAVERLLQQQAAQKQTLFGLQNRLFALRVQEIPEGAVCACISEQGLSAGELQRLCQAASHRANISLAISEDAENVWKFALGSQTQDIRALGKQLCEAFEGRGGGKSGMVQGSLYGSEQKIVAFLQTHTSGENPNHPDNP